MSKTLALLFFASSFFLVAQHNSLTTEDFNSDGITDQMKCIYDVGSSFGGGTCEITDGKTKKTFSLSNYGCFCAIKKRIVIEPDLQKKQNEYFLYHLKKEVLPVFRSTPDQSLLWIINSGLNTRNPKNITDFDLIFNPKTTWRQEVPELPSTYYIEMNAGTLDKITKKDTISSAKKKPSIKKDYLVYFGDTHVSTDSTSVPDFISISKNGTYEILKTKHGVLVKKDKSYKWLFVTDLDINDSPEKLRWASIDEVFLQEQYAIVKQNLAPRNEFHVYLINIETGVGGRLKLDFDVLEERGIKLLELKSEERFSIKENAIVIGKGKNYLKLPLTELKQKLTLLMNE